MIFRNLISNSEFLPITSPPPHSTPSPPRFQEPIIAIVTRFSLGLLERARPALLAGDKYDNSETPFAAPAYTEGAAWSPRVLPTAVIVVSGQQANPQAVHLSVSGQQANP